MNPLEGKRSQDASVLESIPAWPPPGIWWITRDASLDGTLDDCVDVWTAPPLRFTIQGFTGGYWLGAEWDLSTRWSRYTVESMRRWLGVVPDTDRECIRVG